MELLYFLFGLATGVFTFFVLAPNVHHRMMGRGHVFHRKPVACTWKDAR